MNLNQLEYFVSVADNLSFTKAANQCFISQTAITQQIRNLEKVVGVPLFIRDKHHVELTTAGKIYLKEARTILEKSNEAVRLARSAATGIEGELKIGFISGYGQSDCSDILRGFHGAYPNINLSLCRDTMSGLLENMDKGELDVAFILSPNHAIPEYINRQYLRSYPLMAVLYQGHPLAGRTTINYKDLADENFIIMQPSARAKDEMEEIVLMYRKGGFVPNIVALEREPETILLMISIGMGISLMPEYIIRLQQKNTDLRIIPVVNEDGSAETIDFDIAWSGNNVNPAVEKLTNWCKGLE